MDILSLKFLCFILISSLIYWLFNDEYKKNILLIISMIFLFSFGIKIFIFTFIYISVIYVAAWKTKVRKIILIFLCILPLFANKFLSTSIPIIGLSYMCFKLINYVIDIKNGRISNTFIDYLIYLLFFPSVLSGPIEKATGFIEQINDKKIFDENKMISSIFIILYGYFMKTAVANRIYGLISYFYSEIESLGFYVIVAIVLYPIYIYCDFCGYSYIAKGVGGLFGYELIDNFKQPYLSLTIREFWTRWHISLNNWLRDYIYIPLGGNRKGKFRKYINILIVFTISGIWHGTGLGFIMWGLINGLYQIIGDITKITRNKIRSSLKLEGTLISKIIQVSFVYLMIAISWIFFENSFTESLSIIKNIIRIPTISINSLVGGLVASGFGSFDSVKTSTLFMIISIVMVMIIDVINDKNNIITIIKNMNKITKSLLIIVLVLLIIKMGRLNISNIASFIYFKF